MIGSRKPAGKDFSLPINFSYKYEDESKEGSADPDLAENEVFNSEFSIASPLEGYFRPDSPTPPDEKDAPELYPMETHQRVSSPGLEQMQPRPNPRAESKDRHKIKGKKQIDLEKTGQIHIRTRLPQGDRTQVIHYQNCINYFQAIFGQQPEEYYTPQGQYYDDLARLYSQLIDSYCKQTSNGESVWYRNSKFYYDKVAEAMQEYENTHTVNREQALHYHICIADFHAIFEPHPKEYFTPQGEYYDDLARLHIQLLNSYCKQTSNGEPVWHRDSKFYYDKVAEAMQGYENIYEVNRKKILHYHHCIAQVQAIFGEHPEEYYTPQGKYYEELTHLHVEFLNNYCHLNLNGARVWYCDSEFYYDRIVKAMQDYENTYFKGNFTWVARLIEFGVDQYSYTLKHRGDIVDIPIFLECHPPQSVHERYLLAQSIRLGIKYLNANWQIADKNKETLIRSLYEDAIMNGHPEASKTTILRFKTSPNNTVKLWVSEKPKTAVEYYSLAMCILVSNNVQLQGKCFVHQRFWLMNQTSITSTVTYLLTKAYKMGYSEAKSILEDLETLKQNEKENLSEFSKEEKEDFQTEVTSGLTKQNYNN